MKHKILKYCNFLNILILNIFAAGFILSFVSFTQTNWIKNDNYVYGVFQYCTANQIIKLEDSFSFYDQVEVIYRKYTSDSDDVRCFKWSKYTTPAFITLSFIIQLVALSSHLTILAIIIILKIINHKLKVCYKNRRRDKKGYKNVKESCCFKVSYHIAWNFFFCIMSTGITALYATNLILFQYHQNLTNIKINNESLSWCYWVAVAGAGATFLSTCALFVYTIYFKLLNHGESRKFKYSLRYFIDAYKNYPPEMKIVDKAARVLGTTGVDNAIYDNGLATSSDTAAAEANDNNVFFRRNPDIEDDLKNNEAKITHKSEIIDSKKSFNSDSETKLKDDEKKSSSSSSASQQPSSFIYSQVYPCGKKEKDATLKMVVLPFGSLSGTCATGSKELHNEEQQSQQQQESSEQKI